MKAKMVYGGVCAPPGFKASGVACGVKESGDLDLCLLASDAECAAAGAFTRNAFRAAPVTVTMGNLETCGSLRAIVANSGNANACTGERGLEDARAMARLVAEELEIETRQVGVASTGVIGKPLPMDKIEKGIRQAAAGLSREGAAAAARAIMTTDTYPKELAFDFGDFSIGGMAKGAGMIKPDMATMLAFLTTDARLRPDQLAGPLKSAVNASFNLVNIDGSSSTNDMVLLLANGTSNVQPRLADFEEGLFQVCSQLARMLVDDGEGATHCIRINLEGAANGAEAKRLATAVAESPLVKTAFFGGDPNWGRIVQALGAAEPGLDPGKVSVSIGDQPVCRAGEPGNPDEASLREAMSAKEIEVLISLGRGDAAVQILTCDMGYDYVKINAEYHT